MRAFAFTLLLGLAGCACNPVGLVHDSTHRLTMTFEDGRGSCSGTAVGPHALLTAQHCLVGAESLSIDGREVAVKDMLLDHADHAIVLVDETFSDYADTAKQPPQGDQIFICGNPGELQDQCRFGHVSGYGVSENRRWTFYDLNGFFGDSGSGIFDMEGRLIGVISVEYSQVQAGAYMKVMGSLPLDFTKDQWKEASHG